LVALAKLLGTEPPPLRYLSTILYNVEVHADVKQHEQWIYYGGQDTRLSRVSITNQMAPYMSPPGKTGLCVEVTCFEGDRLWEEPEAILDEVRNDLVRLDLVADASDIGAVHVEKVRDTYPIYDLDYRESFAAAVRMTSGLENLKLLGRTGAYWYNNSDHSMKMSLAMARHLLKGVPMADKEALFRA
jgi:protoporphyrinogen oxidase